MTEQNMTSPVFESRRTKSFVLVTVALLGLLYVIPLLVGAYTNWLWFGEVGPSQ